jgi:hypothetical protein
LAYGFAVVMVAVSLYCVGRLLVAKRWNRLNHYDVNTAHVFMGLAMAGMLAPAWNVVPDAAWEVIFGLIALWFAALSVRFVSEHGLRGIDADHVHHISHYLIHMVMAFAMLYMYWLGGAASSPSGATAMSGPPAGVGDPSLTLLFIVILLASAVWQLDSIERLSPRQLALVVAGGDGGAPSPEAGATRWLAPRLEVACHIAMCITMGYMLVLMV